MKSDTSSSFRYLQAATDLKEGDVIFREEPIAVGPLTSNRNPLCFACMCILPPIEEEEQYFCSKCNIALLCGEACEVRAKINDMHSNFIFS